MDPTGALMKRVSLMVPSFAPTLWEKITKLKFIDLLQIQSAGLMLVGQYYHNISKQN